jgi:hypothetical protein
MKVPQASRSRSSRQRVMFQVLSPLRQRLTPAPLARRATL